jgi:aconitase A
MKGKAYRDNYERIQSEPGQLWERIKGVSGNTYAWPASTYIAEPPFFEGFSLQAPELGRPRRCGRAHHGAVRRLDHHRPHLARRLHRRSVAGRAVADRAVACSRPTSTATARAAATTR